MTRLLHPVVLCTLVCVTACASSTPTNEQASLSGEQLQTSSQESVKAAQGEADQKAADTSEMFCQPGAREYKRRSYRWCKKSGSIDGSFARTNEAGKELLLGTFNSGAMDGTWTAFYANGKPRWQMKLKSGKEQGVVSHWYETGTPRAKIPFLQGKRDGVAEFFYPNGKAQAKVVYKAGKPTSKWTYWHDNGQKAHEYHIGKKGKAGIHKHWNEKGKKYIAPTGQLARGQIMPVMKPLGPAVRQCFDDVRIMSSSSGKVVVQVTVGYGGEVSKLDMFDSDFEHPYMDLCTKRNVESLQFPHNPYGPQKLIRSWEFSVE